jgi:hypothetical protein
MVRKPNNFYWFGGWILPKLVIKWTITVAQLKYPPKGGSSVNKNEWLL